MKISIINFIVLIASSFFTVSIIFMTIAFIVSFNALPFNWKNNHMAQFYCVSG